MISLPLEIYLNCIFCYFTQQELALVARVSKFWNRLQSQNTPLYAYKTTVLIDRPDLEKRLSGAFKADCLKRLLKGLPRLSMRPLSERLFIGLNSVALPYQGKLFLMVIDPLFIPSQDRMHGLIKGPRDLYFFCQSGNMPSRRRLFRPFQLVLGEAIKDAAPKISIHTQLLSIGAFPIASEPLKSWDHVSHAYYLLPYVTPYLFLTRGEILFAIYSIPTPNSPFAYQSRYKEDLYEFDREIWSITLENRTARIKITQKTL